MPLPLILGIGAGVAGLFGAGAAISGASDMIDANDKMKKAQAIQNAAVHNFEKQNKATTKSMDELGELELSIVSGFDTFADTIELINNRPLFNELNIGGNSIPKYNPSKLREVAVGADALIGGLGGAAMGTAGGFAASGATTAAVMALGSASTGTAISSLSGAALTNATLAALGGGSLAAGGGGIALGTTVLGAATLGVGLLVGGIIFSVAGDSTLSKANDSMSQAKKTEQQVDEICEYLSELKYLSDNYYCSLSDVNDVYEQKFRQVETIINYHALSDGKANWNDFSANEKEIIKQCVMLVGVLYKMCSLKIVKQNSNNDGINTINNREANSLMNTASKVIDQVA